MTDNSPISSSGTVEELDWSPCGHYLRTPVEDSSPAVKAAFEAAFKDEADLIERLNRLRKLIHAVRQEAEPHRSESFWVIEQFTDGKSQGYWDGGSSRSFTKDIDAAQQFCRTVDAHRAIWGWHWKDVKPTEHLYLQPVGRQEAEQEKSCAHDCGSFICTRARGHAGLCMAGGNAELFDSLVETGNQATQGPAVELGAQRPDHPDKLATSTVEEAEQDTAARGDNSGVSK